MREQPPPGACLGTLNRQTPSRAWPDDGGGFSFSQGRVALITGASKGLGRAMALALAEAGAKLALVSRNLEQLKTTAAAVRQIGTDADVFQADVTDEQQVRRLETGVTEKFGNPHILI